jgi:transmembrane sensor
LRRKAAALLARAERDPSAANIQAVKSFAAIDAAHAKAIAAGADVLRQSSRLSASDLSGSAEPARAVAQSRGRLGLAASMAAAVLVAGAIYVVVQFTSRPINAVLLTTAIGEIREIPLSDGSKVTLDTASAVRVEIAGGHRRALVERGRARFSVARQAEPFTIRTASFAIHLSDGLVDVSAAGEPSVAMLVGRAELIPETRRAAPAVSFSAPAVVSTSGGTIHEAPRQQGSEWPSGRLNFDRAPLADVVAIANRYSEQRIVLADRGIEDLKVTGVFRAGDSRALAISLARALSLRLEQNARGDFLLLGPARQKKTGG